MYKRTEKKKINLIFSQSQSQLKQQKQSSQHSSQQSSQQSSKQSSQQSSQQASPCGTEKARRIFPSLLKFRLLVAPALITTPSVDTSITSKRRCKYRKIHRFCCKCECKSVKNNINVKNGLSLFTDWTRLSLSARIKRRLMGIATLD